MDADESASAGALHAPLCGMSWLLLVYEEDMTEKQMRRWKTLEDFMLEWCRRDDFRDVLPQLLEDEDADFAAYIRTLADQQSGVTSRV